MSDDRAGMGGADAGPGAPGSGLSSALGGSLDAQLTRAQERLQFYESFDRLIQENIARSGELMREVLELRERTRAEMARFEADAERRRTAEREQQRALFSGLLDEMTALQRSTQRLASRVTEALEGVEAELPPAGLSSGAIVGSLPATVASPGAGGGQSATAVAGAFAGGSDEAVPLPGPAIELAGAADQAVGAVGVDPTDETAGGVGGPAAVEAAAAGEREGEPLGVAGEPLGVAASAEVEPGNAASASAGSPAGAGSAAGSGLTAAGGGVSASGARAAAEAELSAAEDQIVVPVPVPDGPIEAAEAGPDAGGENVADAPESGSSEAPPTVVEAETGGTDDGGPIGGTDDGRDIGATEDAAGGTPPVTDGGGMGTAPGQATGAEAAGGGPIPPRTPGLATGTEAFAAGRSPEVPPRGEVASPAASPPPSGGGSGSVTTAEVERRDTAEAPTRGETPEPEAVPGYYRDTLAAYLPGETAASGADAPAGRTSSGAAGAAGAGTVIDPSAGNVEAISPSSLDDAIRIDAPRSVMVLVHGVPRAATALSLQRHLAGLGHVEGVEAREYAEGVLRLQVTAGRALTLADLRSWDQGAELEPVHVHADVIEVKLPGADGF